jgi:CRISPR-associated protein Cas1
VQSGDKGNVEGAAAAYYWRRYIPEFVRDRNSGNPVNSALNYGYTVLRGHAIRAVSSAGLHPGWGVFHHGHGNPFALADDLIEPFRPAIDSAVLDLLPDLDMADRLTKRALVTASEAPMGGDQMSVSAEMTLTAQRIGACFENGKPYPEIPRWRG